MSADSALATVSRLPARRVGPVGVASLQGTLALDLTGRHDPPEVGHLASPVPGIVVGTDRYAHDEFDRFSGRIVQAVGKLAEGKKRMY